jgi:hypothetical protein
MAADSTIEIFYKYKLKFLQKNKDLLLNLAFYIPSYTNYKYDRYNNTVITNNYIISKTPLFVHCELLFARDECEIIVNEELRRYIITCTENTNYNTDVKIAENTNYNTDVKIAESDTLCKIHLYDLYNIKYNSILRYKPDYADYSIDYNYKIISRDKMPSTQCLFLHVYAMYMNIDSKNKYYLWIPKKILQNNILN